MAESLTTSVAAAPSPLRISDELAAGWSADPGAWVKLLTGVVRLLPRGKGVVPKWLGRRLGGSMKRSIRTPAGTIVAIDSQNLDVYIANRLGADWNVDHVRRALLSLLKTDSAGGVATFYDVGANAGFISVEIARRLGEAVRAYAFEPQPNLARCVAVSARLNGLNNLETFQMMAGNAAGEADLFVPSMGVMASSVFYDANSPGVSRLRCPIDRLDRLVAEKKIAPPTLMKIDVEGAEQVVLEGATMILRDHRPAVVFESFAHNADQLAGRRRILELLSSTAPYTYYFVGESGFRPMTDAADATSVDILALPEGRTLPAGF